MTTEFLKDPPPLTAFTSSVMPPVSWQSPTNGTAIGTITTTTTTPLPNQWTVASPATWGTYPGPAGPVTTPWVSNPVLSAGPGTGDLHATGKLHAKDVVVDGVSMLDAIKKINERLAILVPDPVLLAKYEALQELYSQYKMMEALLTPAE